MCSRMKLNSLFNNYSSSPNGLIGCGGERNNCFSKIQLVVQKNIETKHTLIEKDHLCGSHLQMTLKMASAQVVETSVTNNSPSQDSYHPDDLFQSRYATPGFKPFSY